MSEFLKGLKVGLIILVVITVFMVGFYLAIPWLEKNSVEGKVRQMNYYDELNHRGCEK